MRLLPVAERELRVASRQRATYWVRFAAAAGGILVAMILFFAMFRARSTDQSQVLFIGLSVIAFAYCLVSGVVTTSDCVSEERREGTLGLLFLTDLRGYDVVIGKLLANSMRSISALAALVPMLALPVMMGGVEGDVVWTVAGVLANTMFLSLSLGVLVSTLSRNSRQAIGGTILLMLGILVAVPALRLIWIEYVVKPGFTGTPLELQSKHLWVQWTNPVLLYASVIQSVIRGATNWRDVAWGLGIQHALAWLALIGACIVLPRSWRDPVDRRRGDRRGARTATPATPNPHQDEARRMRAELLDLNPFAWIVARERRAVLLLWLGLAVVAAFWFWGFLEAKEDWLQGTIGLVTVFAASFWLKVRLAASSCRHLLEHRRSGALELVLSTAMTPELVVRGLLLGLRQRLLAPLATVIATAGLLLAAALREDQGWGSLMELPMTFLVGVGVLLLDLLTLAYVGMWQGLKFGRYVHAYLSTLSLVMGVPWILFCLSTVVFAIFGQVLDLRNLPDFGYIGVLLWWVFISVLVDLWLLMRSVRGLRRRFRDLAADPFAGARRRAAKREPRVGGVEPRMAS